MKQKQLRPFALALIICVLVPLLSAAEANSVFYGRVVERDENLVRAADSDGKIVYFWIESRTRLKHGLPRPGDRVKIEYRTVRKRNAIVNLTVLKGGKRGEAPDTRYYGAASFRGGLRYS